MSSSLTLPTTESAPAPSPTLSPRILLAFILLVTALAYLGTLRFEFVYDDGGQIVYNPLVQSWSQAPRYWVEHMWSNQVNVPPNYYRPMFLFWCLLNYTAFGLHPLGWHASTVALHLLVTWAVWRLVRRLGLDDFAAAAATLVFALHPVHVESVAWISGVTDPLLAVFLVPAFLAYLNARQQGPRRALWWFAALVLAAAAMLSKEIGIVFVLLVAAYEWICGPGTVAARIRTALVCSVPFALVTAGYLALRYFALRAIGNPVVQLPLRAFPLTWPSLLWFYVRKLFWPAGLSPFYDTPYVLAPDWPHFGLPLLALGAVAILFWLWWRTLPTCSLQDDAAPVPPRRLALFAGAWIFIPLAPVMDIVGLEPHEIAHDRYLYLPAIGFGILVAMAIRRLRIPGAMDRARLFGQPALQAGAVLVLLAALTLATVQQCKYWASDLLLFYRAVQIAPTSLGARNNLADALLERALRPDATPEQVKLYYQEGIALHQQILRADPNYWESYYNLGNAYSKLGRYQEAEQNMFRAAQLNPVNPHMFLFLGMIQMKTGHLSEAEHNVREAIRIWPNGVGARYVLGLILEQQGRPAEAVQQFEQELKLDPDQPKVRDELEKVRRVR